MITNPAINTTHTIIEGDTLSVTDETLQDVSIYPNPVEDLLQIITSADVINKIAKKDKISMVLQSRDNVLFATKELDLTDRVVKEFEKR